MRKLLLVVLAQVGLVFGALNVFGASWKASVTLNEGGTFTQQAYKDQVPAQGGGLKNYVELLGNATVSFTVPETAPSQTYAGYVNTCFFDRSRTFTLTLDFTAFQPTDRIRFTGSIACDKLIIKGTTNFEIFGADYVGSDMAKLDFNSIEYVDADGESVTGVTLPLKFVQILRTPTPIGANITIGAAPIVLTDAGQLDYDFIDGGKYKSSNADFIIENGHTFAVLTNGAVNASQRIVIKEGGAFEMRPYKLVFDQSNAYLTWWGWSSYDLLNPLCAEIPNDIVLEGPNSKYAVYQHYFSKTTGKISGCGQVLLTPNNGYMNSDHYKMVLSSSFEDFTGTLSVTCCTGAPQLVSSELDLSRATVKLENFTKNSVSYPSMLEIVPEGGADVGIGTVVSTGSAVNKFKVTGCQVTIGEADGALKIVDGGSASVLLNGLTLGSSVFAPPGVTISFGTDVEMSNIIVLNGAQNGYLMVGPVDIIDFATITLDATQTYTLVPVAGKRYVNIPANVRVSKTADGEPFELVPGADAATDIRFKDGAVTIADSVVNWQSKATAWFDFNDVDSLVCVTNSSDGQPKTYNDGPLIRMVKDCRGEGYETYSLNNNRYPGGDTDPSYTTGVYPYLNPFAAGDSKTALYCVKPSGNPDSERRRIALWQDGAAKSAAFKTIIMVFGSQRGGGRALFANSSGAFVRNNDGSAVWDDAATVQNYPLLADGSKAKNFWIDGTEVDPTKEGLLDGGWQVISLKPNGSTINGLGYARADYADAGGQIYAEIIFFDDELNDAERIAAEKYLAEKWSIAGKYHDAALAGKVRAFGSGTITLAGRSTELGGAFAGTVNVGSDSRLVLGAGAPPPTADDIPGVADGRVLWMDPDYSDDVHGDYARKYESNVYTNPWKCDIVFDRDYYQQEGRVSVQSSGQGRAPAIMRGARGLGPERTWLDFRDFYVNIPEHADNQGNCFRLTTYPWTSAMAQNPITARTVFLVSDSVYGGGTPFMGNISGAAPGARINKGDPANASYPIWRNSSAADIFGSTKGGVTHLDGVEVAGESTGFSGGPELLTAVGGKDFNLGAFGNYQVLDGATEQIDNAEVLGEAIVYDRVLDADDIAKTEAYLMYKWLGILPAGFDSHANLTIAGSGTVELTRLTGLPSFDEGFEGTVELPGEVVLEVGADGYAGEMLDIGAGTLSGAKTTSLVVNVTADAKMAVYPVAKCAALGTLGVTPFMNVPATRRAALRYNATEGQLELVIQPASGMIFLLK